MSGYKQWGFKEGMTSNDVNNYLMSQAIPRFDSAGERSTAITSPQVNQYAYVNGVGLTRYTGSDWAVEIAAVAPPVAATRINFTSFYSTWTNYAGGYQAASYYKTKEGIVHVEAMLRAGASSDAGEYALVLPAGYRPASALIFPAWCRQGGAEKGCRINLNNVGQLQVLGVSGNFRPATTDWLSMSGISFLAGA